MKVPLKHIAILVIASLTGIFAYQAHWLVNMYHTTKAHNHVVIQNAIRNADYLELMLRTDSIGSAQEKEGQVGSYVSERGAIAFSASFDRGEESKVKEVFKQTIKENDSTVIDKEEKFDPQQIGLPNDFDLRDGYHALEFLAFQVQKGLHSVVDVNIIPINVEVFDSLLHQNLTREGLDIRHYTRIVKLDNDSTLATTLTAGVDTTRLQRYEHVYDAQSKYAFRVFTEPTDRVILMQMGGILATSLFILIVLGVSFWFLIRTIIQQKTLDEMKSDFTNNVTHELKTPIAVAYAANDVLLNFDKARDKAQRDKYLRISQEQLQKLSGLVEQILSMSMENRKTFKLKPEEVEVNALIASLVEQHRLKAKKAVHFEIETSAPVIMAMVDRTHFSNIVSNLMDNAIKYSAGEAHVGICTRTKEDGRLEVSITDSGIGIPPEKQRFVFDKFYRVPTGNLHNVKGYGLGLYYVKTIVEKMGGEIEVKSETGKGSRFTVRV